MPTLTQDMLDSGSAVKLSGEFDCPPEGLILRTGVRLDWRGLTLRMPAAGISLPARFRMLRCDPGTTDVRVIGGKLIGNRAFVGEHAIGVALWSSYDIELSQMTIEDFHFDGVYVGGNAPCEEVTLREIVCTNNRRAGISIVNAEGVKIDGCSMIGANGQSPEAGINCEPGNPGERVNTIFISDCSFVGNAGTGLYLHKGRHGTPGHDYTVLGCYFSENRQYNMIANTITNLFIGSNSFIRGRIGLSIGVNSKAVTVINNTFIPGTGKAVILTGVDGIQMHNNTGCPYPSMPDVDGKPGVYGSVVMTNNV